MSIAAHQLGGLTFNQFVKATLVRDRTRDGLMNVINSKSIGKEYVVDLASVHRERCWHSRKRRYHYKTLIWCIDLEGHSGWMPLELLHVARAERVH